ncbi:hypothetical protein HPG69_007777, partial [Diceros bicornis minor]
GQELHFPAALRNCPGEARRRSAFRLHLLRQFDPNTPTAEAKFLNMGSFVSQTLESVKVAASQETSPSSKPPALAAAGAPTSPEQAPIFNNCWSCRVLSGSGLIGAGGYVYWVARKPMKLGYPPTPGTITQMVIGIIPAVILSSSVPVPVTHRASMGLMDVLDRYMDIDRLQSCRSYKTEKTDTSCHSLAVRHWKCFYDEIETLLR